VISSDWEELFLVEQTNMARPKFFLDQPRTEVYVGDCRDVLKEIPAGTADLIFADPPFNWDVPYGEWNDAIPRADYLRFTYEWLDGCLATLSERGSFWVNIPDDTAAEIVVHLKNRGLVMVNWCIWHFRFGQHRTANFIVSKVHALYFARNRENRTWNPEAVLEPSDRAAIYADPRTRETRQPGLRVPLDVWYGTNWGRIQGNNKERRPNHQNQIPEVYMERVLRACSNEGDLVLDPFLGSGTTCTVARVLGRRSLGIEYSAKNARSAFERIGSGAIRLQGTASESNSFMRFRKRGGNSYDHQDGVDLFDALEPSRESNADDEP
jgi:site-specific DNA-methyltransferase (adenine-specific)